MADIPAQNVSSAAPRSDSVRRAQATRGLRRGTAKLRAMIRRRRFIAQFVAGPIGVAGDGKASALAAGLARTPGSAAVQAHRYLHDPAMQNDLAKALDRHGATDERLLEELTRIALGDPREVQEWGENYHRFVPSKLLTNDSAATVQGVSSERTETATESGVRVSTKLKLHQYDKVAALALLTKIRGMVKPQRWELTGRDGGPIEHAVRFYLPAPARAREPVVIDTAALPQNGATGNGEGAPRESAPEGRD